MLARSFDLSQCSVLLDWRACPQLEAQRRLTDVQTKQNRVKVPLPSAGLRFLISGKSVSYHRTRTSCGLPVLHGGSFVCLCCAPCVSLASKVFAPHSLDVRLPRKRPVQPARSAGARNPNGSTSVHARTLKALQHQYAHDKLLFRALPQPVRGGCYRTWVTMSRGIPARADNDVAWDSTVRLPRCRDAWALGHDRPQLCRRTAQRPGRSSIRTHAPKTLVAAAAKGSAIDWRRIRCRGKGAYPKGRRARGLVRTPT